MNWLDSLDMELRTNLDTESKCGIVLNLAHGQVTPKI